VPLNDTVNRGSSVFRRSTVTGIFRDTTFKYNRNTGGITPQKTFLQINAQAVFNNVESRKLFIPLSLVGGPFFVPLAPSNNLAPGNLLAPSEGSLQGITIVPALSRKSIKLFSTSLALTSSQATVTVSARSIVSALALAVTEAHRSTYARSLVASLTLSSAIRKATNKFLNLPFAFFVNSSTGGQTLINLPAALTVGLTQSFKRKYNRAISASANLLSAFMRVISKPINNAITFIALQSKIEGIKLSQTLIVDPRMIVPPFRTRQFNTSLSLLPVLTKQIYATRILVTSLNIIVSEAHGGTASSHIGLLANINSAPSMTFGAHIYRDLHSATTITALLSDLPAKTLNSAISLSAQLARRKLVREQLILLITLNKGLGVSPTVSEKDFGLIKLVSAVLVSK
jgi:hypothetical protein